MAGISKATLFRWLKDGTCKDARCRDIRGWRLFTKEEVDFLVVKANGISETSQQE